MFQLRKCGQSSTRTHRQPTRSTRSADNGFKFEQNLKEVVDTSFSQVRNVRFSQTACLENKSREIMRMVVLDKLREKCILNKLKAIGVEKHIDNCIKSKVPLSVISTDECGELTKLIKWKLEKQFENLGIGLLSQNDACHKIKNSKKARKAKFQDPKIV